jgi:hypothetical protein
MVVSILISQRLVYTFGMHSRSTLGITVCFSYSILFEGVGRWIGTAELSVLKVYRRTRLDLPERGLVGQALINKRSRIVKEILSFTFVFLHLSLSSFSVVAKHGSCCLQFAEYL